MTQAGTLLFWFSFFMSLIFIAHGLLCDISNPLNSDIPLLGGYLSQYLLQSRFIDLAVYLSRLDQTNKLVLYSTRDVGIGQFYRCEPVPGLRGENLPHDRRPVVLDLLLLILRRRLLVTLSLQLCHLSPA